VSESPAWRGATAGSGRTTTLDLTDPEEIPQASCALGQGSWRQTVAVEGVGGPIGEGAVSRILHDEPQRDAAQSRRSTARRRGALAALERFDPSIAVGFSACGPN